MYNVCQATLGWGNTEISTTAEDDDKNVRRVITAALSIILYVLAAVLDPEQEGFLYFFYWNRSWKLSNV